MEKLLQKISDFRNELKERNIVCITSDMDWASDYAIRKTFEYFDEKNIPLTAFVTNPSEVINEYRRKGKIKCGIHPNFMPDYSGSVVKTKI